MYREPLATNKPKQKPASQPDPLGPARSAVQRRRPRRPTHDAFRPEIGRSTTVSERRRSASSRRERSNAAPSRSDGPSDSESLFPLLETGGNESSPPLHRNMELENLDRQFQHLTRLRDMLSILEAGSMLPVDDLISTALRHISTSPNPSSDVSGDLPAILDRARGSSTPLTRGAREQLQLTTRMTRPDYRRRGLTREEVDGLGDRRRSLTPEDYSWETLRTTITPDERLPSVHSSFTSTDALATSDPARHTAVSLPTSINRAACTILSIHSFIEESGSEEESDTSSVFGNNDGSG